MLAPPAPPGPPAPLAPGAPPSLAGVLMPRVVALWVLSGCLLKAFLGTPADLPLLIQRAPLAIGTTFALVLGLEAAVGLLLLLRPSRGWPFGALLLAAFVAVLSVQLAEGKTSCGCFGATIDVPVWLMLALDALLLAALLAARPWTLPRGGVADVAALAAALAFGVALPLLTNREATVATAKEGQWVPLNVREWKGKRLSDTPLGTFAAEAHAGDGLYVFYRDSCPYCARCMDVLATAPDHGKRELILVRLPEEDGGSGDHATHALVDRPYTTLVRLPETVRWYGPTPPARLVVEGGVVVESEEALEGDACRW